MLTIHLFEKNHFYRKNCSH